MENKLRDHFLKNMGVSSLEKVNDMFRKSYANQYRIDHLTDAVELVKKFKEQKITIVGDYDVDGVSSTSILMLSLKWAGFTNVSYRIPKRFTEGFGINMNIVNEIDEGLVITCDNGIAQVDVIHALKEKGISVLILDHHEASVDETKHPVYPDADVLIDPDAVPGSADFDGYCGAGLCYRFACELLEHNDEMCAKLLSIAALGTVGDMMELKEENYVIVRNGIRNIKAGYMTLGMRCLLSECGLLTYITAHDIGFTVDPCINSASRMDDDGAKIAVDLLINEDDYASAKNTSVFLIEQNRARKEAQKKGLEEAEATLATTVLKAPIILYLPSVKEGIVGIVAGQIAKKYGMPAFVFTNSHQNGVIKASGRSCGNYNMVEQLVNSGIDFVSMGGHEEAAGVSIRKKDFGKFVKNLQNNASGFICTADTVKYDIEITEAEIPAMLEEMQKYEPYGNGNPSPVFKISGFTLFANNYHDAMQLMGEQKNNVKLFSKTADAIGFGMDFVTAATKKINAGATKMDLIGNLSHNYYKGKVKNQVEICEIL